MIMTLKLHENITKITKNDQESHKKHEIDPKMLTKTLKHASKHHQNTTKTSKTHHIGSLPEQLLHPLIHHLLCDIHNRPRRRNRRPLHHPLRRRRHRHSPRARRLPGRPKIDRLARRVRRARRHPRRRLCRRRLTCHCGRRDGRHSNGFVHGNVGLCACSRRGRRSRDARAARRRF